MLQKTFSAVNEFFSWVKQGDGSYWYEWDPEAAQKAALKARNAEAKLLTEKGYKVRKFSLGTQQLTKGGIGTPYPEITIFAKAYGLNASSERETWVTGWRSPFTQEYHLWLGGVDVSWSG